LHKDAVESTAPAQQAPSKGKVFSTKGRGPFRIIYYEACQDEHDAKAREIYLNPVRSKIINLFHIFNVS
jgi:predicted GIY-YIG superfamily endonuclease